MQPKINLTDIPLKKEIIDKIRSRGGEIYLVGGAVRDLLLGFSPRDFDFLVLGLSTKEFQQLFPQSELVGKNFSVILLAGFDFIIQKELDLNQELLRRDYSINALAVHLAEGKIIDPAGGLNDLSQKKLRPLAGSLKKDPVRIYRGLRLICQLSTPQEKFQLTKKAVQKIKKAKHMLGACETERIFQELCYVLNTDYPQYFFQLLQEYQLLNIHFVELNLLSTPEFEQLIKLLAQLKEKKFSEEQSFVILVHQLKENQVSDLCQRLDLPVSWQKTADLFVRRQKQATVWPEMKSCQLLELIYQLDRFSLTIKEFEELLKMIYPQKYIVGLAKLAEKMYSEVTADQVSEKLTGPEFGARLFSLRCSWLDQKLKNSDI